MRTPTYRLKETFRLKDGYELEKGTFLKLMNMRHVPQHIKDECLWPWFTEDAWTFVYTYRGIILLPIAIIEVSND